MANIHQASLLKGLKDLLVSGSYSDLIIICGSREFKAHRAILCQRSPFFAAACNGRFQESMTGKVVLEEDDVNAVERMLTYLYNLDYDDGSASLAIDSRSGAEDHDTKAVELVEVPASDSHSHEVALVTAEPSQSTDQYNSSTVLADNRRRLQALEDALVANVQVYAIAEKYDIPELKDLAKSKTLDQVGFILSMQNYPEIIKLVYESTPSSDRGLRDALSLACMGELRTMVTDPVFDTLLREVGDFGIDLLCGSLKSDRERMDQMLASKTELEDRMETYIYLSKAEISDIKNLMADMQNERDEAVEHLDQILKVSNAHKACRHCDAEFSGCIDENEFGILRCSKCRTKHR